MESSFLEEEEDQQLRLRITDLSPVKGDAATAVNPPDLTCHAAAATAAAASPQMRLVSKASVGNKNVIEVRYRGELNILKYLYRTYVLLVRIVGTIR